MEILQKSFLIPKKQGSLLPPEYQRVEWVGSTGEQHIELNQTRTGITGFEISFMPTTTGATTNIFGTDSAGNDYNAALYLSVDKYDVAHLQFDVVYAENYGIGRVKVNDWNTAKLIDGVYELEGVSKYSVALGNYGRSNNYNIVLFGRNRAGEIRKSPSKVKKFILYGNNAPTTNIIPCYRKADGEIGFYDMCGSICPLTNTPLFTNAGTGTFLKGADV